MTMDFTMDFKHFKHSNVLHLARIAVLGAAACALLGASVATAQALQSRMLTASGEVAQLVDSTPNRSLSVVRGETTFLVPGTEDPALETPLGVIGSHSGHITALWLSWRENSAVLSFATLADDVWEGPFSLLGGGEPIAFSGAPYLMLDEQRSRVTVDEGTVQLERQVIHVVWLEDGTRVRYSPLTFNDGFFVGWNEIVTLTSAYRSAHENALPTESPTSLPVLLEVQNSANVGLHVTLTDPEFGRIGTLRIHTVPLVLEILGDSLFDHALDSAELHDPNDVSAVADEIRGHIVHVGSRLDLDPAVTGYLSDRVGDWLLDNGPTFGWDLLGLAAALRANSLDISRSVYHLTMPSSAGDGELTVLDIGDFLDDNGHRDQLSNLVGLQVTSDFKAPESIAADPTVHLSKDGSAVAFSWSDDVRVRWIDNRGDGWSDVKTLTLTDSLDAAQVRQLIESSIR